MNISLNELERNLSDLIKVLRSSGGTRPDITRSLTNEVCIWARKNNFSTSCEHKVFGVVYSKERIIKRGKAKGEPRATGYIDVWARKPTLDPLSKLEEIAFEIDHGNKIRSLDKLLWAHKNGAQAVWIRWGGNFIIPVPKEIHLIDLQKV
jgi:hypothetical protein